MMIIWKDYIWMSAWAVIFNEEWKVFLAKRGSKARDDQWKREFPWWTIKFNETREDAAIRNVKRKYDFDINITTLLWVYDVIDKEAKDHWISTTYTSKIIWWEPVILDTEKCSEIGWFTLEEVKNLPLSRITKRNLSDLQ